MFAPSPDLVGLDLASIKSDPLGPWTLDDLQVIPDALARRCEIVDGALVMSPAPRLRHEAVSVLLQTSLNRVLAPQRIALGPIGVDIDPSYLIPDLAVIDRDLLGAEKNDLDPRDVDLVVEIVSPSSATADRVTKPALYAAHGIGAYWRVETEGGVAITAHVLREGDDVYTELGTWHEGETLRVSEPLDLTVEVSDCAP